MTAARPHCLARDACQAKGDGHCKRCAQIKTGQAAMVRLRADPVMVERMRAAAVRNGSDPAITAKRVASRKRNRVGQRRIAAAGRRQVARINGDPALCAKRHAALLAAVAGRVQRNAERLAAKVGIPLQHVSEFRFLRYSKHYTQAEAVDFLIGSYPDDFETLLEARRAASLKARGPMPAIGMPDRAAWTRRAARMGATEAVR